MYDSLSETQKKAVDYFDGNSLIIAGAGSGKTRVIVEKIKQALIKLNKGEKILAITFSNKAAEELQERLEEEISREEINEKIFVGTVHNFCLEIVSTKGDYIGLPENLVIFETYEDRLKIFEEAINNTPNYKIMYKSEEELKRDIRNIFDGLSRAKRELKFYYDYEKNSSSNIVFKEYDELLISQNAIDFDDILRYAYKILVEVDKIKNLYQRIFKYIFIDEAQDLNRAQYEVIKLLTGVQNITTMVGDPNQSIYGFNGSSSSFFTENFKKELKATEIKLNENFRSSKKVVKAAKALEQSYKVEGKCYYDGEFEINSFENSEEEAKWIFSKIKELIRNGHPDIENNIVSLEKCAVIARNRYIFNELKNMLDESNTPYTLKVSMNNMFSCESTVMKIFEYGIRLIINRKDKLHLNYLNELLNSNFTDIESIIDYQFDKEKTFFKDTMPIVIASWRELQTSQGNNIDMKKILSAMEEKFKKINNSVENEDELFLIYSDIDMVIQLWNIYLFKSNLTNRSLVNFMRSISLGETQINKEEGLTLSTVHMSKGLEYDVVFIMGVNDGVFPDYRAINNEDKLIEEKHNMFVSITRSKRLCYVTYPKCKMTNYGLRSQQESRFITEIKQNY